MLSAMEIKTYIKNSPQKASQLISVLIRLPKLIRVRLQSAESVKVSAIHESDTEHLRHLLEVCGSDKSVRHDYHLIYGPFLSSIKNEPGLIVEIGLGTHNPTILSHMDSRYKPLGGIRAFRDFLPNAHALGADIDREVLVSEERLDSYYLNQLKPSTFSELQNAIRKHGGGVNFAVIDGLHRPVPDLNSVIALIPYLKVNGRLYVEDISKRFGLTLMWKALLRLLPKNFRYVMTTHEHAQVIMIERMN